MSQAIYIIFKAQQFFNMKNFNTKSLLMTPKQFYARQALRQQSQAWSQNEILFKKTIELFFQSTPIVDFDPAEQFQKIQHIPLSQDRFCTLLTQVIFKKTKDKVDWAKNFLIIKSKKPALINQPQENQQQQPKIQPLKINRYKFLVDILINIKMSCSRLQQLLYKMMDMHDWRCQEKNTCKESYMEGYLAKLLFKKIIVPSGIFDPEQQLFRSPFDPEWQAKLNSQTQFKDQHVNEKKGAKQSDFMSLKRQVIRWGPQLIFDLAQQKTVSNSLDQKPSSQNKFFICRQCFYRDGNIDLTEAPKKKNKKKNKNKPNPLNTSANANLDLSQQNTSQDPSRKNSAILIEDQTTTQDMDEQLQYQTEKYYEKVSNFLEDFKIDLDNRFEIRLRRTQSSDDESDQPKEHENRLMNRIRTILYKDHPNLN